MITNQIIEAFLDCKYKAHLLIKGQTGVKKEFEVMKKGIKDDLIKNNISRLIERYGEQNVLKEFKFDSIAYGKYQKLAIAVKVEKERYHIIVDGLEIHFGKNALKKGRYVPIIFSEREKISKREKLILTIQSIILGQITGLTFTNARVYYGKEMKTLRFNIERFISESLRAINDVEKIISGEFEPVICKKDYCRICEYEEECKAKLIERDDLSLLSCIGEKELVQYEKKGIFTVKQLSYTFKPRRKNEKVNTIKHPYYASLQALALREKKVYVYDKVELPKNITKIYLDCEGDIDNNSVYLIGLIIENESGMQKYQFWADSKGDEQTILNQLYETIKTIDVPTIFYYGKYDYKILKKTFTLCDDSKLKRIILGNSIDVLKRIRCNIYFPTYSNSLKEIAKYLGFLWSDSKSSGLQSIVWRFNWEQTRDSTVKDNLLNYNYEDCVALKTVVDFIYSIFDCKTDNDKLVLIEHMDPKENQLFKNMTYATKDVEIITKGAYFQYQRNKIFFRTNKKIKRIKRLREMPKKLQKLKINKVVFIKSNYCPFCRNKDITRNDSKKYIKDHIDLRLFQNGIKRWITRFETCVHYCETCRKEFIPSRYRNVYVYSRKSFVPKNYLKTAKSSSRSERPDGELAERINNHQSKNSL